MSNLEELKNKLCPNGVEFVKLGEVAEIGTGSSNTNEQLEEGLYPFFVRSPIVRRKNDFEFDETAIITAGDGDVGKVFHYIEGKYALHQRAYRIHITKENIVSKFIYYYMMNSFYDYISKKAYSGTVKSIRMNMLTDFEIPIPPLEVQEEIVQILDPLTKDVNELVDLLKKEQELRKKQYAYYRDKLLTFDEDVPRVKLGEVCEKIKNINWKKENNISKKYIDLSSVSREFHKIIDNEVKEVNSENAPSRAKQIIKINDILFGTTRPMLKRYCIVPEKYDEQICSTGFCVLRIVNKDVLVNFIYHCLSTSNFYNFIEDNEQGTTYPAISDNILKEYKIPLPPIEKQKEIVTILDNLEQYYNNLQESLPSEIEKRKKQYEFYRDKLLTF